jgi:AAA+ ATPase superfamily predicted ATPase
MSKTSLFFGRQRELGLLKDLLKKKSASLVVIKGRRRIGKSRLAEEFSRNIKTFFFVGLPPGAEITAQNQRDDFAKQLERELGITGLKADDWG